MKNDHWQHVSLVIRAQIDISEGKFDEDDDEDVDEELNFNTNSSGRFRNIVLGAKQKPLSFAAIESQHSTDPLFKRFREQFCLFLSVLLPEKTVGAYKSIFHEEATVSSI
jgi:hypothetical protein